MVAGYAEKSRSWVKRIVLAGLVGLLFTDPSLRAEEALGRQTPFTENGVDKVLGTKLPYWRVGNIDKKLSRLCSLGEFNQRTPYRFSGQFKGFKGSALVGGAKGTGLNLWDPKKKATPTRDYWFYRDRTSACIVMWAKVKPVDTPNAPTPLDTAATTRK